MVLKRAAAECPKKVAGLMDLVNLPTQLREFAGGRSQMSHISFFLRVWSYIKDNKLQVILLPMYGPLRFFMKKSVISRYDWC